MKDTLKSILEVAALMIAVIAVLMLVVALPLVWAVGNAHSDYLRQAHGIEVPWYKAAFLTVTVTGVKAEVNTVAEKKE